MDDFETLREYISIHSYERAGAITALDRIENFHVNLLARVRELEAEVKGLTYNLDLRRKEAMRAEARAKELEAATKTWAGTALIHEKRVQELEANDVKRCAEIGRLRWSLSNADEDNDVLKTENERLLKHLYDEHGCSDPPLATPEQSRPPQI